MTKLKKYAVLGTVILTVGATSLTAFAASNYNSPAEAVAGLTGKSVDSIIAEKFETGKTYGAIAMEKGITTEFKDEMLQIKKDILSEKVSAGTMTQENANEILESLEENQINCDSNGSARIGQKLGAGFGGMNGNGQGNGQGLRNGQGRARFGN